MRSMGFGQSTVPTCTWDERVGYNSCSHPSRVVDLPCDLFWVVPGDNTLRDFFGDADHNKGVRDLSPAS